MRQEIIPKYPEYAARDDGTILSLFDNLILPIEVVNDKPAVRIYEELVLVEELMGKAFWKGNGKVVHLDGNDYNCALSNLNTEFENYISSNPYRVNCRSRAVVRIDSYGRKLVYPSMSTAAKDNNCKQSNISRATQGDLKTCAGYRWELK